MEKSAGTKAESWTAEDEAAMQAIIARCGRVSITMIGSNRTGGSMSEAAKRPCSTKEDESDYVEWSLEYDLKNYQSLRSRRRNFSFQREWNQLKSGDVSSSR